MTAAISSRMASAPSSVSIASTTGSHAGFGAVIFSPAASVVSPAPPAARHRLSTTSARALSTIRAVTSSALPSFPLARDDRAEQLHPGSRERVACPVNTLSAPAFPSTFAASAVNCFVSSVASPPGIPWGR